MNEITIKYIDLNQVVVFNVDGFFGILMNNTKRKYNIKDAVNALINPSLKTDKYFGECITMHRIMFYNDPMKAVEYALKTANNLMYTKWKKGIIDRIEWLRWYLKDCNNMSQSTLWQKINIPVINIFSGICRKDYDNGWYIYSGIK